MSKRLVEEAVGRLGGVAAVISVLSGAIPGGGSEALAQCTPVWQPGFGFPGANGGVYATMMWDPDGPGRPQQPVLVAGGSFTQIGGVAAAGMAWWDGATWHPFGAGISGGGVFALTGAPNGKLYAGGTFTSAGGQPASYIAQWNGTSWQPMGTGVNWFVQALAALPNGEVVAGGWFSNAGGVPASLLAKWNGTTWSAMGSGISGTNPGPNVRALAVTPAGQLIVGGNFTSANGLPVNDIAVWNNGIWSALGNGLEGCSTCGVDAITPLSNGEIVVGGSFTMAGGASANRVARWTGSAWEALGGGVSDMVNCIQVMPNGDLAIGGDFTMAGAQQVNHVATWDGLQWRGLGIGITGSYVKALVVLGNGDLVASGAFDTAGSLPASNLARWGCPLAPTCLANCDGSTIPPILNVNDFNCFLSRYAAGCP